MNFDFLNSEEHLNPDSSGTSPGSTEVSVDSREILKSNSVPTQGAMERGLHERDRVGVQDFVLLEDFQSEDAFIDNLRKRFKEDLIYVRCPEI